MDSNLAEMYLELVMQISDYLNFDYENVYVKKLWTEVRVKTLQMERTKRAEPVSAYEFLYGLKWTHQQKTNCHRAGKRADGLAHLSHRMAYCTWRIKWIFKLIQTVYYFAFHIFSTNFKGPAWISELKLCQSPPLPPLWRTCVDSAAALQDVDMLHRRVPLNVMAFTDSGREHVRCVLDFWGAEKTKRHAITFQRSGCF